MTLLIACDIIIPWRRKEDPPPTLNLGTSPTKKRPNDKEIQQTRLNGKNSSPTVDQNHTSLSFYLHCHSTTLDHCPSVLFCPLSVLDSQLFPPPIFPIHPPLYFFISASGPYPIDLDPITTVMLWTAWFSKGVDLRLWRAKTKKAGIFDMVPGNLL